MVYCPPLEGVNFELYTFAGFRGRTTIEYRFFP